MFHCLKTLVKLFLRHKKTWGFCPKTQNITSTLTDQRPPWRDQPLACAPPVFQFLTKSYYLTHGYQRTGFCPALNMTKTQNHYISLCGCPYLGSPPWDRTKVVKIRRHGLLRTSKYCGYNISLMELWVATLRLTRTLCRSFFPSPTRPREVRRQIICDSGLDYLRDW